LISDRKFEIYPKILIFLPKVRNLSQNFDFWPKVRHLFQNFDFRSKLRDLSQNFDFWQKLRNLFQYFYFWSKLRDLSQNFDFWTKVRFWTNISILATQNTIFINFFWRQFRFCCPNFDSWPKKYVSDQSWKFQILFGKYAKILDLQHDMRWRKSDSVR